MFNLFPIAFLDAPQILTTSVTSIPAVSGSPLQVIDLLNPDFIAGPFVGVL